ncbi:phosphotransferase [Halobacteriovorax marinus]|uniref:phosphotransferase n=1 Tax=Halobacteriovorax marinus TaxID=97084 RepID=UPI003A95C974
MGDYTKLSKEDAQNIIDLYDLGKIDELSSLSLGISNSNYKVEIAQSTYLLKVSNDKGYDHLKEEQDILTLLSESGFKFSLRPFTTTKGENVYTYDEYFGVIFPFIEGIAPGPCDQTCLEIGKGLATLHRLDCDSEKVRSHQSVGFGPAEIIEYLDSPKCPDDFNEMVNYFFPDKLASFIELPLEKGIIHGDLYYDNTLFDENHLAVILDFEQAGVGEYLIDLGISISGTCLEKGRINTSLIKSYLEGYEEVRPLSIFEKENLDKAIVIGFLSIALWRIKRFKEGSLNPLMANSYQELLNKAKVYWDDRKNNE